MTKGLSGKSGSGIEYRHCMATLLRTRMTEDLRIRNYSEKTVSIYVRCVAAFAKYFGRSPEELDERHIREYQRYLVEENRVT